MSRYFQGVDINEFELTFQETITTGSDDAALEDWKRESVRMKQVYANSLLNVGALDSTNPAYGLFQSRPLRAINTRILWSSTKKDGLRVFYITSIRREDDRMQFINRIQESALMRRGWVIQECVLAPRMLSFGSGEVFWQCSQLAACETYAGQDESDKNPASEDELTRYPFWMLGYPGSHRQYSVSQIKTRWIGTLNAYCHSNLTYPEKDLFIALDGMGALLLDNYGGRFKYGMWDATFPEHSSSKGAFVATCCQHETKLDLRGTGLLATPTSATSD
ncbi:hypothetical protein NUW58_g8819 [Xylaria curta]|uniref:Uncharacterized protein n=1 Tax=Xylaria curta TaxID=42375 RepID=A0ACC1N3R3_9PEZI|nr:hypothetical protein NUW58_g8819 [Xylaria curta]